jgi:hypothetical protein
MPVRRTMALVGAVAVVLLFVAGRIVGGTLVGAAAGLSATFSPLLQTYFVQARTEALLAAVSALGLVLLLACARRFHADGRLARVAWWIGPTLGLALAVKLTAAVAILGACAWGGTTALIRARMAASECMRLLLWCTATGLLAAAVWIVVNPFLWPDPVGRTWSMLEQQQSIMVEQGEQFGNPVTDALPGRLALLVRRTFVDNSTPAFDYGAPPGSEPLSRRTFSDLPTVFGVSVELVLAAIGLAILGRRALAGLRSGERPGVEAALLWWLAAYAVGIGANLSLDWPRYYVPTAFFGSLLIGLGIAGVVRTLTARVKSPVRPVAASGEATARAVG